MIDKPQVTLVQIAGRWWLDLHGAYLGHGFPTARDAYTHGVDSGFTVWTLERVLI